MVHRKGHAFGKSTVDGYLFIDKEDFLKNDNGCLNVNKLVVFYYSDKAFFRPHIFFNEKSKINSILNQKGNGCD